MLLRHSRFWLLLATPLVVTGTVVFASPKAQTAATVQTLFRVAGTGRAGELRYGVRLDDRCRPVGSAPIVMYRGERRVEPAGLGEQLVHRTARGGYVYARLSAASDRPLLIASRQGDDGACEALPYVRIDGRSTLLDEIDVEQPAGGEGDGYVELRGKRLDGGGYATEQLPRDF